MPITAPTLARGVRDYSKRSCVVSRVSLFIPWIHPFESEVNPPAFNEKSSYHRFWCSCSFLLCQALFLVLQPLDRPAANSGVMVIRYSEAPLDGNAHSLRLGCEHPTCFQHLLQLCEAARRFCEMLFVVLAILPVHFRHTVAGPESHSHFERHFVVPFVCPSKCPSLVCSIIRTKKRASKRIDI